MRQNPEHRPSHVCPILSCSVLSSLSSICSDIFLCFAILSLAHLHTILAQRNVVPRAYSAVNAWGVSPEPVRYCTAEYRTLLPPLLFSATSAAATYYPITCNADRQEPHAIASHPSQISPAEFGRPGVCALAYIAEPGHIREGSAPSASPPGKILRPVVSTSVHLLLAKVWMSSDTQEATLSIGSCVIH
jgi:hypothetical protein